MAATPARAYLDNPQDERFETRIPGILKRHAESVARTRGESLSEYVLEVLAERVATDILESQELRLTPVEQVELLRVLSEPAALTPALQEANQRARDLFGA